MKCEPTKFYPFSDWTYEDLVRDSAIFIGLFFLSLFIFYREDKSRKNASAQFIISIFTFAFGFFGIIYRLPLDYKYYQLTTNYQITTTKTISERYQKGGNGYSEKYFITHRFFTNGIQRDEVVEVYPDKRNGIFKNINIGGGEYWIYYNPKNPETYLIDFHNTYDKINPVCKN